MLIILILLMVLLFWVVVWLGYLVSIAFSINLMFWGRVMGKIKLVCSWVELQVIKAVLYSVAVIAAYAVGTAVSLCLFIPAGQMLGLM